MQPAHASKLAAEMRDQTALLYNKPIDTNLWAEAALYVTVREGLQAKEESSASMIGAAFDLRQIEDDLLFSRETQFSAANAWPWCRSGGSGRTM